MGNEQEEKIRIRAYEIWERTGHSGNPEDHWFQAEVELELEQPAQPDEERKPQSRTKVKTDPAKK
jgi:hypothetical protein